MNTKFTKTEIDTIIEAMAIAGRSLQRQINTREGAVKEAFVKMKDEHDEITVKLRNALNDETPLPLKK